MELVLQSGRRFATPRFKLRGARQALSLSMKVKHAVPEEARDLRVLGCASDVSWSVLAP